MSTYGYLTHSELYHHGIKGMKWGIRRYQNPDGSLTPEGERRYYSYEGAKRARHLKNAGLMAGMGSGLGAVGDFLVEAYRDSKTPENIKNTKQYKTASAIKTAGAGAIGLAGMIAGASIEAKNSKRLNDIIKNSSKEEFDKIKNDKHFANHPVVKNRIHFDNFEKLNKITKNMSNKQKAEIYVKNEFEEIKKKSKNQWTPDDSEGAWYNSKLAGDWYGLSNKEMEKLCWKYEKHNNPDFNH